MAFSIRFSDGNLEAQLLQRSRNRSRAICGICPSEAGASPIRLELKGLSCPHKGCTTEDMPNAIVVALVGTRVAELNSCNNKPLVVAAAVVLVQAGW